MRQWQQKFSWRLILIHLAATLLMVLAAMRYALLSNIDLVEAFDKYGIEGVKHMPAQLGVSLGRWFMFVAFAPVVGFLLSFVLSFILCLRKKLSWLNSLLVLICGVAIRKTGFLSLSAVKFLSNFIGEFFHKYGFHYAILISATLLLIASLYLFFSKLTNRFIAKEKQNQLMTAELE